MAGAQWGKRVRVRSSDGNAAKEKNYQWNTREGTNKKFNPQGRRGGHRAAASRGGDHSTIQDLGSSIPQENNAYQVAR